MTIDVQVDWRAELGPVRDQGPHPTCLSHATSTAHEYTRGDDETLSAECLHYYANSGIWTEGTSMADAARALREDGQPAQQFCDPLVDTTLATWTPPSGVPFYRRDAEELRPAFASILTAIKEGNLPVIGMTLPASFRNPQEPWIVQPGAPVALHAVIGVGLGTHQGENAVLIRNSWGNGWGDEGHAWLSRACVNDHCLEILFVRGAVSA